MVQLTAEAGSDLTNICHIHLEIIQYELTMGHPKFCFFPFSHWVARVIQIMEGERIFHHLEILGQFPSVAFQHILKRNIKIITQMDWTHEAT